MSEDTSRAAPQEGEPIATPEQPPQPRADLEKQVAGSHAAMADAMEALADEAGKLLSGALRVGQQLKDLEERIITTTKEL